MKCPLCDTPVTETDVSCPGCDELLSEWRIINSNSRLLRQRGLILADQQDLVGACLAFMQAAISDPTNNVSLVDAGRSLLLLGRSHDASRILKYAHQRSRESGARELLDMMKKMAAETAQESTETVAAGGDGAATWATAVQQPAKVSKNRTPLLGLEILVRKKVLGGTDVDTLWSSILHTERNWQGAWGSLQTWLTAACEVDEPHTALIYMRGLDAWWRDDSREALMHFSNCILKESSILNPVAWGIYVTLTTGDGTGDVVDMAVDRVGSKGLRMVVDVLSARLKEINSEQSRKALRQLRNLET